MEKKITGSIPNTKGPNTTPRQRINDSVEGKKVSPPPKKVK